ncbi:MaoC family dehydratase [Acrocarpospora pleiomorpha]|uniref:MaoC family dehydratase n=1 Tax=Acrocarpospora pleiomorpha TaxID=90975 RepID=A0A5M3XU95_9ACTN|nr:MaoC family dehydratase [Acrocarpospora pleiomorpha]GES24612.1 MaoC family dehydratase [Acrocarpospora pleiomorpha]
MTRIIASADEARALIGEPLGVSEAILVDQTRIDDFADATDDHQWIHIDTEKARSSAFGGTIAHGYLTLSLLPRFASQIYRLDFGAARLNYGSNKVRYPTPVRSGSVLRATATLIDVRPAPQGTFVTARYTITADGAPKPACVAETITLVIA